jgi:hypothetical protein
MADLYANRAAIVAMPNCDVRGRELENVKDGTVHKTRVAPEAFPAVRRQHWVRGVEQDRRFQYCLLGRADRGLWTIPHQNFRKRKQHQDRPEP